MLGHVALDEHDAAVGVQAGREQLRGRDPRPAPELRRVLWQRDRVQVHHAVDGVVGLLQCHPLPHGTEIVAEVE